MKAQIIMVLGAGAGGLQCARLLARQLVKTEAEIILVDIRAQHYLHLELYSLLSNQSAGRRLGLPVRTAIQGRPIRFIQDLVVRLNPVNQTVELHDHGPMQYDYLVVALGSKPADYGIPGLREHAYWFSTVEDTIRLRQILIKAWQHQPTFHLVLGGAGVTGVELAGSVVSLARAMTDDRPRPNNHWQLSLIEAAGHILPGQSQPMIRAVNHYLKRGGFDIYTKMPIARITDTEVKLASQHSIPYDCFVWTGGVKAHPLIKAAGFETDSSGRAIVNSTLQARGYGRVYVVGDCAAFKTNRRGYLPRLTWHAVWQAYRAANNIARQIHNLAPVPFRPREGPTIITLGQTGFVSYKDLFLGGAWVKSIRDLAAWWYYTDFEPLDLDLILGHQKTA